MSHTCSITTGVLQISARNALSHECSMIAICGIWLPDALRVFMPLGQTPSRPLPFCCIVKRSVRICKTPVTTDLETLIWNVERLWQAARDLPIQERSIESLIPELQRSSWWDSERPSAWEGVLHAKRILEVDLAYPVILAPTGWLMDGAHRVAKAWIMDHSTINVVQFVEMPEPDEQIVREQQAV